MKDDLECFAIYWAIAYNICTPPLPPGCEDVPFLLTPETPEDWIKLHLPLKTFIKHWSLPWNMGLPLKNMVLHWRISWKLKLHLKELHLFTLRPLRNPQVIFIAYPWRNSIVLNWVGVQILKFNAIAHLIPRGIYLIFSI